MKLCILLIVTVLLAVQCGASNNTEKDKFPGLLYGGVKKTQPGNFLLSPLSLRNALAVLYLGASEGPTKKEFKLLKLNFPKDETNFTIMQTKLITSLEELSQHPGVTFVAADKIYVNSNLNVKSSFKTDVNKLGGGFENVDFSNGVSAAQKINKWVRDKTAGKIEKIVDSGSLNDQTNLLLLNTIYFKGLWENQFRPSDTRKRRFFLDENQSVDVDMMYQENDFQYGFLNDADADAEVINLPYQGGRLSMMVYMPNRKTPESLDRLENWLKKKLPSQIHKTFLQESQEVSVFLPKFKIRSSLQLNEPLKSLGLERMFDESRAKFTKIFKDGKNSFVSKVTQETFIEVNEEGTEAAAATGFEVGATSFGSQFLVDRPFVFQIWDKKTEAVLFMGRVKDPRE